MWCTDFTYLNLTNGSKRYNCTIIDLHDRFVVATLNAKEINSELAINTIKKAFAAQPRINAGLILHSDQGAQFTSKAFVDFCSEKNITQSMSKAGYPYDNAYVWYNHLRPHTFNN